MLSKSLNKNLCNVALFKHDFAFQILLYVLVEIATYFKVAVCVPSEITIPIFTLRLPKTL